MPSDTTNYILFLVSVAVFGAGTGLAITSRRSCAVAPSVYDLEKVGVAALPDGMIKKNTEGPLLYDLNASSQRVHDGIPYATNSVGLRDIEHKVEKPEGTKRIILLGDSYTFGYGLEERYNVVSQLRGMLEGRKDLKNRWEIFNFSVPGFNTVSELKLFEQKGLQYRPDVVVLMYYIDDVHFQGDNPPMELPFAYASKYESNHFVDKLAELLEKGPSSEKGAKVTPAEARTIADFLISKGQLPFIAPLCADRTGITPWNLYPAIPYLWEPVQRSLERLKQLGEENGFQIVFAIIPWTDTHFWSVYPYHKHHQLIHEHAAALGFPVLDFLDLMSQFPPEKLRLPDDAHTNPLGDFLFALAIENLLVDRRIIETTVTR